ncbi:universal stress family protein [Asticcacaulis biprosthecium C19]|uniref:Universal stress family protein n=1 Tax=Asticcacaulis biprosthecium C19 TaxID=715226 RepID=F4QTG9_9CAUL|nr:universal stress protein [Asticcacaulis biprosthecium]EGF90039.1 universal stress family protein [Asticcacaulis biprosthecium C19]
MSAVSPKLRLHLFGGHAHELNALSLALAMARHDGAHLRILHIAETPFLPEISGLGAYGAGAEANLHEPDHVQLAQDAAAYVRAYCLHEKVPLLRPGDSPVAGQASAEFRNVSGTPATVVMQQALSCDLVVSDWNHQPDEDLSTTRSVLFGARRPIMLLPRQPHHPLSVSGVTRVFAFAWDGSRTAAQALRAAVPSMQNASEVYILHAMTGRAALDTVAAADVLAYLRSHGISATFVQCDRGGRSVGQTIVAEAEARSVGLLALGAYSRGHLAERVFGGVTRHVLRHARLPLLLAH